MVRRHELRCRIDVGLQELRCLRYTTTVEQTEHDQLCALPVVVLGVFEVRIPFEYSFGDSSMVVFARHQCALHFLLTREVGKQPYLDLGVVRHVPNGSRPGAKGFTWSGLDISFATTSCLGCYLLQIWIRT